MSDQGRVAILISGRGSNMHSLVTAMRHGPIQAEPVLVLSNRPEAAGIDWAHAQGIQTKVIDHRKFKKRKDHEVEVLEALAQVSPDLICLAGYMRLLSANFVKQYPQRIMNIHPSLLPSFPGLHAQQQAIDYGAKYSGCTVHFVDELCDHGPIIRQSVVPVMDDDTEDSLAMRILEQEHKIYPDAVRAFFAGELQIKGRRVLGASSSVANFDL